MNTTPYPLSVQQMGPNDEDVEITEEEEIKLTPEEIERYTKSDIYDTLGIVIHNTMRQNSDLDKLVGTWFYYLFMANEDLLDMLYIQLSLLDDNDTVIFEEQYVVKFIYDFIRMLDNLLNDSQIDIIEVLENGIIKISDVDEETMINQVHPIFNEAAKSFNAPDIRQYIIKIKGDIKKNIKREFNNYKVKLSEEKKPKINPSFISDEIIEYISSSKQLIDYILRMLKLRNPVDVTIHSFIKELDVLTFINSKKNIRKLSGPGSANAKDAIDYYVNQAITPTN